MLGHPPRAGYEIRGQFCGVVATWLGASTGVAIVFVASIAIAVDNGAGCNEARYINTLIKLKTIT